jgi:glycosyltransferase involved in cell wall biosynthesis
MTVAAAPAAPPGRVLFVGQAYYNTYYLSRALRRRGWIADVLSVSSEGADAYSHGYDIRLDYTAWDYAHHRRRVDALERVLRRAAGPSDGPVGPDPAGPLEARVLKALFTSYCRHISSGARRGPQRAHIERLRAAVHNYDIFHFTNVDNLRLAYFFNPNRVGSAPVGWDIQLLKRLGKKIVYSNTSCHDGVTQSSFRRWGPVPVCDICRWRAVPEMCSDARNHAWGRLRNRLADYQITCGGNRVDYNDDPRVHEVPQFYCLDPSFWHPDLLVPTNYRLPLPSTTVRIYHAVGNYDVRSDTATGQNIKSTHIYIPVVEQLKREGYDCELIFFQDVPNRQLRYYQVQADIVVDMLTFGFFGATIREALMLGKPAVCYLRPEWLAQIAREVPDFVAELPVVSATPETVSQVLRELIEQPERRRELGRRGRAFALKWFSDEAGGRRLDEIYRALLSGTAARAAPAPAVERAVMSIER